jgi:hypothetical protein
VVGDDADTLRKLIREVLTNRGTAMPEGPNKRKLRALWVRSGQLTTTTQLLELAKRLLTR